MLKIFSYCVQAPSLFFSLEDLFSNNIMNNSEQRINKKGDHLPKISNSETVHKVAEILKNNSEGVLYDRPEDDGQSLLAHKTP